MSTSENDPSEEQKLSADSLLVFVFMSILCYFTLLFMDITKPVSFFPRDAGRLIAVVNSLWIVQSQYSVPVSGQPCALGTLRNPASGW